MGRMHVTFRLTPEAIAVIEAHQAYLSSVNHREVDRTDALEDIILNFPKKPIFQGLFHRRRLPAKYAGDDHSKPLEAFQSA